MTFDEFSSERVGQAYDFANYNCEHFVLDGLNSIHGIDIKELNHKHFELCQEREAHIFSFVDNNGNNCHVGLVGSGRFLHAMGGDLVGQVYSHNKSIIMKLAKNRRIEFYKCRLLEL